MNGVGERKYAIYLIVGEVLRITANRKVTSNELLRKIDSYCGTVFKEESAKYLQLAYIDQNEQVCWLRGDRAILDFEFPERFLSSDAEVPLHQLFRFYPNPLHLKDPKILVFLFLDSRQQFLKEDVQLDLLKYARCCACLIMIASPFILDDQKIVDAFQIQISPSISLLKRFDISVDEIQHQICKEYSALEQFSHAELMIEFLLLLETHSPMYGSYFYKVYDKFSHKCKLAVNGKGLVKFSFDDLHRPQKAVSWQQIENVYYAEKQFTLELTCSRGMGQSPSSKRCELLESASNSSSPLRIKNELSELAENTLTSRQLSSPSRAPQKVVYICENALLCKTIWEAVVAQHQHFLDQRTCKKVLAAEQQLRREEQCERLEQHLLAVSSSKYSRLPSSSSLESFASMPSAKVADGHYSRNIQAINCEKTEEDRKRDTELVRKLNEQRVELEDRLLQKLLDLKSVCIREGEITGKLPNEIYKTLLPEEELPVVKKRLGTTFKFSEDVLQQASLDGDRQTQLAIDIELHRKIVAAAERLATDKSTNKSVRKKRRKDWQAASQKLKGLEKGLHKLRVCSSKPDSLNFETVSMSNAGSGFSLNSLKGWPHFSLKSATKSCPTTPRGSIPDLSTAEDVSKAFRKKLSSSSKKSETELMVYSSHNSIARHPTSTSNSSLASNHLCTNNSSLMERANSKCSHSLASLSTTQLPPSIPNRRVFGTEHNRFVTPATDQQIFTQNGIPLRDAPLYANVGYTSSVPYKSAYRQSNFPTIQQHSNEANNNFLPKRLFTSTENNYLQPPNPSVVCTRFSAEKAEGCNPHRVMSSSLLLANSQLGNIVRKMSESVTPCSSASSSSTVSSGYISNTRTSPSKVENLSANALKPPTSTAGFSTTSLDRRTSIKGKSFISNKGKLDLPLNNNAAQPSLITTFPVNDICRPLELGDFSKYRSISAVRNNPTKRLGGSSASASRILSSAAKWPPIQTDPRMEALLASIHSRSAANGFHLSSTSQRTDTSQTNSPTKTAKNTATNV